MNWETGQDEDKNEDGGGKEGVVTVKARLLNKCAMSVSFKM